MCRPARSFSYVLFAGGSLREEGKDPVQEVRGLVVNGVGIALVDVTVTAQLVPDLQRPFRAEELVLVGPQNKHRAPDLDLDRFVTSKSRMALA